MRIAAPPATQPLVSVIMNTYNGEPYLREAIDSVLAQDYQNWELIFWDDASTDKTPVIAKEYAASDSRVRYFRVELKATLGAARNLALQQVRGTYIGFLDSDDLYLPDAIARQVQLIEAGDYGMVYGRTIIIDERGEVRDKGKVLYRSGRLLADLLRQYDIRMGSALVRRAVLEDAGSGFNETFRFAPDYNLFMQIAAAHEIGVIREPIYKYRRSSGSLTQKSFDLVSREVGQTLDDLETLYPDAVRSCPDAMQTARDKLCFYDAVNHINQGRYSLARSALAPVVAARWQYLGLYLALLLPIPRRWVLRAINRQS